MHQLCINTKYKNVRKKLVSRRMSFQNLFVLYYNSIYVIFMLNYLQIVCYNNLLGRNKYPRTRMFACNFCIQ